MPTLLIALMFIMLILFVAAVTLCVVALWVQIYDASPRLRSIFERGRA